MSSSPLPRLPFGPLVEALGAVYQSHPVRNHDTRRYEDDPYATDWQRVQGVPCTVLSELTGISVRRWQRWSQVDGVPIEEADRVAIAIGLHPSLIWPEWFTDEPHHAA